MKDKSFLIGFLSSLILPAIFIAIFVHFRYHGALNIIHLIKEMFRLNTLSGLLAVGAFPNLFMFLFAMQKENWMLGRGVISATLIYGIVVMIMKFI